jgi:hypothetical protein
VGRANASRRLRMSEVLLGDEERATRGERRHEKTNEGDPCR